MFRPAHPGPVGKRGEGGKAVHSFTDTANSPTHESTQTHVDIQQTRPKERHENNTPFTSGSMISPMHSQAHLEPCQKQHDTKQPTAHANHGTK